jgi:hypothetical protein
LTEPIIALVFILAPFVLNFDDASARLLSVVLGVVVLVGGMTTRWRYSLVKLLPLRVHFMTDVLLGVVALLAPFVLGFSDETEALVFFLVMGVGELAAAFGTAWEPADEREAARRSRPGYQGL